MYYNSYSYDRYYNSYYSDSYKSNHSYHCNDYRYFAASFEHQKALFAWGGRGAENAYCADLWRLDPSRAQQDVVHCEEVPTSGSPPPAKFAATLTNCDDRFALLYGGGRWVLGGRFQPDVETYTLDLATHAWARLALSGPQPRPRCQHAAVNLGGNLVLVLGGYDGNRREYLGLEDMYASVGWGRQGACKGGGIWQGAVGPAEGSGPLCSHCLITPAGLFRPLCRALSLYPRMSAC